VAAGAEVPGLRAGAAAGAAVREDIDHRNPDGIISVTAKARGARQIINYGRQ
jgi:hypothetical protein